MMILNRLKEIIWTKKEPIVYIYSAKGTVDGDIVGTPGVGHKLRIHFILINNAGANNIEVELQEGAAGTARFRTLICNNGGAIAMHLPNPWDLPENTSLYYDWIAGAGADILITIGYEDITI